LRVSVNAEVDLHYPTFLFIPTGRPSGKLAMTVSGSAALDTLFRKNTGCSATFMFEPWRGFIPVGGVPVPVYLRAGVAASATLASDFNAHASAGFSITGGISFEGHSVRDLSTASGNASASLSGSGKFSLGPTLRLAVGVVATAADKGGGGGGDDTTADMHLDFKPAVAYTVGLDGNCALDLVGPGAQVGLTLGPFQLNQVLPSFTQNIYRCPPPPPPPVASQAAGAYVYWTNNSGTIGRANLDGTLANQDFITTAVSPYGVAVDAAHVYWTNTATNTIGRANLDGTGANQSFITGANAPYEVAVDATHVYWTNNGTNTIGRANLDGTNSDPSFIPGASNPQGVAVDAAHVYWANTDSNTIGRANLDGTGANQSFTTTSSLPVGVAVDAAHVYWANVGTDTIGRANLDGTGTNQSFIDASTGPGSVPYGVAVDAAHVYWANFNTFGPIARANLDGTGANQAIISGALQPAGVAVTARR